jgi:3-oxoacyl-[acyl-carrier-protein] synthase II
VSVVVTGLGAITPLGRSVAETWPAVVAGETAAQPWPDLEAEGYRIPVACRVPDLDSKPGRRGEALALAAAQEALAQAGLPPGDVLAIFVGTTLGESEQFEAAAAGGTLDLASAAASHYPRYLQQALGVQGPARAYGTACAAGNYAIGAAAAAVAGGQVTAALAGGVEPFSRIALVGFSRTRAMAGDLCRPFDAGRRGMQLGEAAVFLVLEREEQARARGARPLATVVSLGLSCDAHHPIAPEASGAGMLAAMEDALASGGVEREAVGLLCAHGSGTRASDAAEARAIAAAFPQRPAVFGTKGALGHSLGAATAVEAVLAVMALDGQLAPPTANLQALDPAFNIDVTAAARPLDGVAYALNCGFAFGGINSALLLGRAS